MATIFLLVCVMVGISIGTSLASPEEQDLASTNDNFIYLGSIQNARHPKTRSGELSDTLYMLHKNSAQWSKAKQDCINTFGVHGSLVNLETKEELQNLTAFLDNSGEIGMRYWTGGKYDVASKAYRWDNGVQFGAWVEWQGNVLPVVTGRAMFRRPKQFLSELETISERYICEVNMGEEQAIPCYFNNDLTIIIDSSGSVGQQNYMAALEFAAKLGVAWADNPGNRLSVIIYSQYVQIALKMKALYTVKEIRDAVYSASWMAQTTDTAYALRAAVGQMEQNPRSVPKNIVLITDGYSDNSYETELEAKRIKDKNIRGISVGVGSYTNAKELLAIAGGKADHVFTVFSFNQILKVLFPVSRLACE